MANCQEKHPQSGDVCSREAAHAQSSDPLVQQHITANGLKWPSLRELAPNEGYNEFVTFRM